MDKESCEIIETIIVNEVYLEDRQEYVSKFTNLDTRYSE